MDAERARAFLLTLPHAVETLQWGENLVFWTGDKALGGKMFALMDFDFRGGPVISFAAGPERAAELCEVEGFRPAPYLARAHWVAAERWDVLPGRGWQDQLRSAHGIVYARLPPKTVLLLELPKKERERLIVSRRKLLAAKAEESKARRQSGSRSLREARGVDESGLGNV